MAFQGIVLLLTQGVVLMRIMLVEDDVQTAAAIESMLRSDGSICDIIHSGEDALEIAKLYQYDIIILDIGLPDFNGHELLQKLRSARVKTPVLVLSGYQEVAERIKALGAGADDFLCKPFNHHELTARIHAIVRRSHGYSDPMIEVGDLCISLQERTAFAKGKPIKLTGKEYQILELLALRKGSTISKEMFLNYLYGGMDEPEIKIIDVFVCKLRKKLLHILGPSAMDYIETVWGRGYTMKNPQALSDAFSDNTYHTVHKNGPMMASGHF